MPSAFLRITTLLLAGAVWLAAAPPLDLEKASLTSLEQRLASIDTELSKLARFSLRNGFGSVGYRSRNHVNADFTEWVQIDLGKECTINELVLVPVIWRESKTGFRADSFPSEFHIIAGKEGETEGKVIASFSEEDKLLPRIGPVLVKVDNVSASWVRIVATKLSPREWDGLYELQLAEVFVFEGDENVALHRPVETSSHGEAEIAARHSAFLVDGFVPYLMNAASGEQSIAMVSGESPLDDKPYMVIDLGEILPLNRIHLHSVDVDDTIPQSVPPDFGIPRVLLVEGALEADFSDATELIQIRNSTPYDAGPIIMHQFPEKEFRYIRLTALHPYIDRTGTKVSSRIGFAEIELFSNGKNVARGKPVTASFSFDHNNRKLSAVTDGNNLYGNILPIRKWLEELARRQDLENERPIVAAMLSERYTRQKSNLRWMGWLATVLAASIIVIILWERNYRMRQIATIKERLAADLHDELGADLHTIGLLSDLAEDSGDDPQQRAILHQRIRNVTEQTGTAVRHCTDMLSAKGLSTDFRSDMDRASRRIMSRLSHKISIEGEEHLARLKPRTRNDLFLFFKECLVNISRHSGATEYATNLTADTKSVQLSVSDNGRGLPGRKENSVPGSLMRRASLMGAKVSADTIPGGGTCINLTLNTRKWLRRS
ncbi:MAG: ATP-binding protein [Akkermansiaceae bacterium]|nr:ATP-binding protein [Akkermansiaceae bacterium]MDP4645691.1 ATP-binding protein [Akkermansiaceae bacterium]MDP4721627.1 ATP-binding protein [Akkermansiaceae bacterium]MDP4778799.1 ATP-binding protein [Akkermansiaceae bacterium]MDP4846999.1 ATP-binding protein [Akkermansiaceae bacterium]